MDWTRHLEDARKLRKIVAAGFITRDEAEAAWWKDVGRPRSLWDM